MRQSQEPLVHRTLKAARRPFHEAMHDLSRCELESALQAVLDACAAPAYLADVTGAVLLASSGARQPEPLGAIQAAARGRPRAGWRAIAIPRTSIRLVLAPAAMRETDFVERLLSDFARRVGLTSRETQVLALVAKGATNRDIAQELSIAEVTVENHISRLLQKAGAARRSHLLAQLLTDAVEVVRRQPAA